MGYFASENCEGSPGLSDFVVATSEYDGSALVQTYEAELCSGKSLNSSFTIDSETLSSHACDNNGDRWYSSNEVVTPSPIPISTPASTSSSSGIGIGAIIGIAVGALVLILVIILTIFCCKRRAPTKSTESQLQPTASLGSSQTDIFMGNALQRQTKGLLDDDAIVAKRISRSKILIRHPLSQGAYGEVFSGVFNGQQVAVKMLLPAMRGNLQLVNQFLAEAKMTAAMDHPHIVSFIGVAWDSLSDVCVVLEFIDGDDLRSLLEKFLASHHQVGFTRQKVTIALQVCHALTYLHSLMPPVIHRDLKSRNILLNRAMEAKLTDFGISKEWLDRTLTAGVGTSLWMAPEVMLGEWCDDKADMFSFGVVLSELDVHTLPYTNIKQNNRDPCGRQITDTVLLQQVASGKAKVEFSSVGPLSMAQLGYACVSMESTLRPSAAEALYRLQTILTREL